ncbi:MAG: MBL fold metallo-hydrolase [Bacilli bacterium]|nr:MBL fold metallo-hydrolase [Bacilli bacterium]
MQIRRFRSKLIQANCYFVIDGNAGIIIDPSVEYDEVVRSSAVSLAGIFITHGHFDHISELDSYIENSDAPVYLHKLAFPKLNNPNLNCSTLFPLNIQFSVPEKRIVCKSDTSELMLLSTPIRIIETPGHTDCSLCIMIADMLFSGDTLFKDSIGRTDLPGAAPEALIASFLKLKNLNPALTVYPGHGDSTLLGRELTENPYIPR